MITAPEIGETHGWARLVAWPRFRFTLAFAILVGFPLDLVINSGRPWYLFRTIALGAVALLAFGVFEQWPRRLPKSLARWVLQVVGVAVAMPLTTFLIWVLSNDSPARPFWTSEDQLLNFAMLTILSLLLAPWAALAALVRQKDALARHQALTFHLERSELGPVDEVGFLNRLIADSRLLFRESGLGSWLDVGCQRRSKTRPLGRSKTRPVAAWRRCSSGDARSPCVAQRIAAG